MEPTGRAPANYQGFQFSLNNALDREKSALAASTIGATSSRIGWNPQWIERERGVYNWNPPEENHDERLVWARKYNLIPQAIMGYNTFWNAPPASKVKGYEAGWHDWLFTYPVDMDAYRDYVRAWMERYGQQVLWVEPWNEPGWFGGVREHPEWFPNEKYLQIQRINFEEARRVNPNIRVMTGGFANSYDPMGLHVEVVEKAHDFYDVETNHAHGEFSNVTRNLREMKAVRERVGDGAQSKPFYWNETAMAVVQDTPGYERRSALHMAKVLPFVWANGAVGHSWFKLYDDAAELDPARVQVGERWGMWDENWQPKATVVTYNTLTKHLRGKQFARDLAPGDSLYAYAFGNDPARVGEWTINLWRDGDDRADELRALQIGAGARAYAVDLMGQRNGFYRRAMAK